jgi:hypothetical protein
MQEFFTPHLVKSIVKFIQPTMECTRSSMWFCGMFVTNCTPFIKKNHENKSKYYGLWYTELKKSNNTRLAKMVNLAIHAGIEGKIIERVSLYQPA